MQSACLLIALAFAACGDSASRVDATQDSAQDSTGIETAADTVADSSEPEDVPAEIETAADTVADSSEPEDVPAEIDTTPPAPALEVETGAATALGLDALSANGRVHAHGNPGRYYFELGETTDYGRVSPTTVLPAHLGAHYHETWDTSLGGWAGGMSGVVLQHVPEGGIGDSGFVRYPFPGGLDANHADGIGANELVQYMYPGRWEGVPIYAALGGGDPDMRGARFSVKVRGNDFVQNSSELVFWLQSTPNLAESYDAATARWSNWAYSAANLTEQLLTGEWEDGHYQLLADTNDWTYAGHYVVAERATYIYVPLDQVLSHLNGDFFHMQVFFEFHLEPQGSIDFDEFAIDYPQRSLIAPANGGLLVDGPAGAEALTDGWRHGPERTWFAPGGAPIELTYELAAPVVLQAIQLHQDPEHPTKGFEVLASADGVAWEPLARGSIAASHPEGPNYAFYQYDQVAADRDTALGLEPLPWRTAPTRFIKVRLLSGYGDVWGLGEIEAFAEGIAFPTEDDWISLTTDFADLTAGTTYHYRLVAIAPDGRNVFGSDQTFTVPATRAPLVKTQGASRIRGGTAKVEARVSPLGEATICWFDYGPVSAADFPLLTFPRYCGLELTPRTFTDILIDLVPGTPYHYRFVAENASGKTYGEVLTVVAE